MNNTTATGPYNVQYGSAQGPPTSSWDMVARFLHHAAGRGSFAVMTVHVLVDEMGRPIVWSSGKVKQLEPKARGQALADFLETFSK
jgi:hypothetical protein